MGILAIQIPEISKKVKNGDILTIDSEKGVLTNSTTSQTFKFTPFPEYILNIIQYGGALNFVKEKLGKH